MLKLYGMKGGSTLRNDWLLYELGVEFEFIHVDLRAGEHKSPEFLKMNPSGQVPVLVDGEDILTESLAINNYLAEKHGSNLAGSDVREKAEVLRWSLWGVLNVQRYFGDVFRMQLMKIDNEEMSKFAHAGLDRFLPILDEYLSGKAYLVSERFTLADINVATGMTYTEFIGYDLGKYQNIVRWMENIKNREAYQKARATM